MALWDDLSKKASETTAKAVQQAKVLSETSRLNGMISDEEKKINNNYYQIGKLYATIHAANYEVEFAGMISGIIESEQKINEYRKQIQEIKGVLRCEKCGAEVAKGVAFCSSCGSPMPKVEVQDFGKYETCSGCGAKVEKGMRFCTFCGKPMAVQVVSASEQPENLPVNNSVVHTEAAPVIPTVSAYSAAVIPTCSNCGTRLEDGAMFCTECGMKVL